MPEQNDINIYNGDEPYVFVSYARKDKKTILPYLEMLSRANVRIWYDHGILGGQAWRSRIENRIRACHLVLVFATQNSLNSTYVKEELGIAKDVWKKPILPIFFENAGYEALLPDGLVWMATIQCKFLDKTTFENIIAKDLPKAVFAAKNSATPPTSKPAPAKNVERTLFHPVEERVDNCSLPRELYELKEKLREDVKSDRVADAFDHCQSLLAGVFPVYIRLFDFDESLGRRVDEYLNKTPSFELGCAIVLSRMLQNEGLHQFFTSPDTKNRFSKGRPDRALKTLSDNYCQVLTDFDLLLAEQLGRKTVNLFRCLCVPYAKTKTPMEGAPAPKGKKPAEGSPKPEDKKWVIQEWDVGFFLRFASHTVPQEGFGKTSVMISLYAMIENPYHYDLKKLNLKVTYGDGHHASKSFAIDESAITSDGYLVSMTVSWPKKETIPHIDVEGTLHYKISLFRPGKKVAPFRVLLPKTSR